MQVRTVAPHIIHDLLQMYVATSCVPLGVGERLAAAIRMAIRPFYSYSCCQP